MNSRSLTIGAALLGVVVVVLGFVVYLNRGEPEDALPAPASGPGSAAEARGIIADIEARRGEAPAAPSPRPLIESAEEGGAAAGADAGADAEAGADEAGAAEGAPAAERTAAPAAEAAAGPDDELDAAYERARELQAAGQLDDAQVLFFFGARQGHARSAYAYAEMNDPNHHSPETSLLAEPDAFQAFRWYSAALDGGMEAAAPRLEALREWAETEAAAGNAEAERLLLQWEQ